MKKTIVLLCSVLMCATLFGCSKEEKSIDQSFIDSLQEGLITRWNLSDKDDNSGKIKTKELWDGYINAELNKISSYKDAEFENKELGDLAVNYIKLLEDALNTTKYLESNNDLFWSKYNPIQNDRCITLVKINKIHALSFDNKKNMDVFEGLINDGELSIAIKNISDKIKFKMVESEDNKYITLRDYEAIVENTSDIDYKYFIVNINLVAANGVVVETTSASTENWESGSKHKFSFSTPVKFDKLEIKSVDYDM